MSCIDSGYTTKTEYEASMNRGPGAPVPTNNAAGARVPPATAAFEGAKPRLTAEEAGRNRFGPTYLYAPPGDALAAEVWQLAREHSGKDGWAMARVAQPARADDSLAALLTPYVTTYHGLALSSLSASRILA